MVSSSAAFLSVLCCTWSVVSSESHTESNTCGSSHPWAVPSPHNGSVACECGDSLHNVVQCDSHSLKVSVLLYHCMTYNDELNQTLVGHCIYNFYSETEFSNYYPTRTDNVSDLNFAMCHYNKHCDRYNPHCDGRNSLQRTGQMCGQCVDEYATPVYSYNLACVHCRNYKYNWLIYIAVAFVPLTLFYVVVVVFRISATSGTMNGYILANQIISAPLQERLFQKDNTVGGYAFGFFRSLYGIWNLDFFRDMYPPFCLHPEMSTLQTLALDYLIAVYPLMLIVITFLLVHLHDNYRVFILLWKPFNRCFSQLHEEWNIRSSLIGAFATFIILSYVKVLNVSFDLLTPNTLYDVYGNKLDQRVLFYDGTYEYFGRCHFPYAVLAIFMLLFFIIVPFIVVALYPFACFQRCLNHFTCRCIPALHICMDTFHGCFKLTPRHCRQIATFYLMIRILNNVLFAMTTGPMYYPLAGILFAFATFITASAQPYKNRSHTVIDVFLLGLLSTFSWGVPTFQFVENFSPYFSTVFRVIACCLLVVPPLYGVGLLLYTLFPRKICTLLKSTMTRCYKQSQLSDSERFSHQHNYDVCSPLINT